MTVSEMIMWGIGVLSVVSMVLLIGASYALGRQRAYDK